MRGRSFDGSLQLAKGRSIAQEDREQRKRKRNSLPLFTWPAGSGGVMVDVVCLVNMIFWVVNNALVSSARLPLDQSDSPVDRSRRNGRISYYLWDYTCSSTWLRTSLRRERW